MSGFGGSNVSSMSITVGPVYQGTSAVALLPRCDRYLAEIGMNARASTPICARNALYSETMLSKTSCELFDKVHLVHRHDHLADAEQREQVSMATRLLPDAFIGGDQEHARLPRSPRP